MGLNEAQQRAILSTEGPVVIVAPAGSGKTRVLVHRMAHLIEAMETPPSDILGLTFTRKAAGEWQERLGAMVGSERADQLTLGTFHAVGLRLLQEERTALGLDHRVAVADGDGGDARLRRIVQSLPRGTSWARGPIIAQAFQHAKQRYAQQAADAIRRGQVLPEALAQYRRGEQVHLPDTIPTEARGLIQEAFRQYQAALVAAGAVDLQDLLTLPLILAAERLDLQRRWRQRWRYILVDEYQDTDATQDLLLEFLAAHSRNLCVVGDPAQAIYGWRGARADSMRSFPDRHPGTQVVVLSHNYRSTPEILQVAEAGLREVEPTALLAEAIPTQPSGGLVTAWTCLDAESEGEAVAQDILELLERAPNTSTGEIMVLGRSHGVLEPVERALRRHGLPFALAAGHALSERVGVRGALPLLHMIAFPDDPEALHRLQNDLIGVGPSTIERLRGAAVAGGWTMAEAASRARDVAGISRAAQESLIDLAERVRRIEDAIVERGIQEGVRTALEASGLPRLVSEALAVAEEEDEWGTHARVASWLADADELLRLTAVWVPPTEITDPLDAARAFLTDLWTGAPMEWAPAEREARGWEGRAPIRLMTIHAAKGLEADHVYLLGCEEGTLPAGQGGKRTEAQLGEEARLWYVATTRARLRLVVSWAMTRGRAGGADLPMLASRFLAAMPGTCHLRVSPSPWRRREPWEPNEVGDYVHGAGGARVPV